MTQYMKRCLVNDKEQKQISIANRGLAYGDGLFTTAKIVDGQIEYLSSHIQRLFLGCENLGLTSLNTADLTEKLIGIAKPYSLAVLKVIVTAGSGGRGYARSTDSINDLIITVHDYPQHYDDLAINGITLGNSTQKLGINPMLSGLKHLNRLEQVLLRQELTDSPLDDLIVANVNDEVVEATSANLFFWLDGKLCTPEITHSGVNGIMRQLILKKYPDTIIRQFTFNELTKVSAMFICNCIMGVMPVKQYNDQCLSIALPQTVRDTVNQQHKKPL